jgi:hypothetical protein
MLEGWPVAVAEPLAAKHGVAVLAIVGAMALA